MGQGALEGWGQTNPILYPLSSYFIDPLVFSPSPIALLSLAMIYPQLVKPSTHNVYNLLCHPDLPALSHSKQTTNHGWSQVRQDVSSSFRSVFCCSDCGRSITFSHQHFPRSSHHGNMQKEEAAYCVVNKSILAAGARRSNRAL